ncbi:MAG: metallophosphoesterase family protein [Candidatus Dormibacteria bacterium]
MRIAALYDIHGNLPALEAVLAEVTVHAVDLVVLGGDLAMGPMPEATLDLLIELGPGAAALSGNADRELVRIFDGGQPDASVPDAWRESGLWAGRAIRRDQRDYLAALPASLSISVDGLGEVLFCHATARNDTEVFTAASPDDRVGPMFTNVSQPVVVCGHTHMQFDRQLGQIRILNAGSVGMPYADPGAYWLLLGPGVEFRRTDYPLEAAAERIRRTGFPLAREFADENVLRPATAAEATRQFEGA